LIPLGQKVATCSLKLEVHDNSAIPFVNSFLSIVNLLETMAVDKIEIGNKLKRELASLTLTFNGNKEKVDSMVRSFLEETPRHFVLLHDSIVKEKKEELLALLHKLKPRYSYLGLDDLMIEMNEWENEVRATLDFNKSKENSLQKFEYFEKMNQLISSELAQTGLTEGGQANSKMNLPLTGKKVLIAEDDEVNAMVFELFIEELGGITLKATDGNQAVQLATQHHHDLIFMDVHMPYFSGVEAIKLLRAKNFTIPIISLSASTRLQEKQQSLDAGANSFLTKPAKREAIQQVLLQYLS
jgi:CheY-like chemotaxis protein